MNRDDILNYQDGEHRIVTAWGKQWKVRSMNVTELFAFHKLLNDAKATGDYSKCECAAAAWCIVDEDDKRILTDEDIEALGKKSHKHLSKIFSAVVEMNTISDDSIDAKKKH